VAALSVNQPRTKTPPGWAWVPLLRLARQESGPTPSRSAAAPWNGDIPWIGIRDAGACRGGVIQDTAQRATRAGSDHSSDLLLDFLKYPLLAEWDDIRRSGKDPKHTTTYFPESRAKHIRLPPLAEQDESVQLLDQGQPAIGTAEHDAKRAVILLDHLERNVLVRAFRGALVPEDQNDEPANALLPRRGADGSAPVRRGRPRRVA
jgi:type I restriction enzyme S subunit